MACNQSRPSAAPAKLVVRCKGSSAMLLAPPSATNPIAASIIARPMANKIKNNKHAVQNMLRATCVAPKVILRKLSEKRSERTAKMPRTPRAMRKTRKYDEFVCESRTETIVILSNTKSNIFHNACSPMKKSALEPSTLSTTSSTSHARKRRWNHTSVISEIQGSFLGKPTAWSNAADIENSVSTAMMTQLTAVIKALSVLNHELLEIRDTRLCRSPSPRTERIVLRELCINACVERRLRWTTLPSEDDSTCIGTS
mmetsp:Transcript_33084/g.95012  ORF Transcript_33084/g.95012 Transcript_33084/m.95012 type:complete len:256 (+) Transcript_33084:58-825(+)